MKFTYKYHSFSEIYCFNVAHSLCRVHEQNQYCKITQFHYKISIVQKSMSPKYSFHNYTENGIGVFFRILNHVIYQKNCVIF